ncbi:MAG: glutamate-5-semialdehyde dehydrogenase [Christensenellales bacterium]|jgi:glutamate-5-semialdehyde dehydrogenase
MLKDIATKVKNASIALKTSGINQRNSALFAMAKAIRNGSEAILSANEKDLINARKNGLQEHFIERLTLNPARIEAIAKGIEDVCALPDPIGEIISMWTRPNGLRVGQKRVPLGVIGIIFESRPNVTADAAALCIKSGNACILRGGSDAIHSNTALVDIMQGALAQAGLDPFCLELVRDTSRETAREMMSLRGYIDVLIPRGGAGLIKSVVENAKIPVIETGTGNCHVYVDGICDMAMALDIAVSAKISRPSVCNSAETLLVDSSIADAFLPKCLEALREKGVEVRGCEKTMSYADWVKPATEEDFFTEFNDMIYAVKVVKGIGEAISHIEKYSSGHSDAIITSDYSRAQRFLDEVDSAAVYVNASTRFTDGGEFGFGAEIGISNQKLHARGPMGLRELTTIKYIIYGNGQTR